MIGNGTTEGVRNSDNLKRFEDIVANVLEGRAGLLRQLTDPRRDIDGECGYPSGDGVGVGGLNSELYRLMYEREAVANRVVQVYPKESWQVTPLVYEDEDPAISTEFEAAWDALGQSLRGEQCWYQDEKGSPVWEHLKRADILSGIGHFGVILLAFDDGLSLDQPLETVAREEVTPEGERVVNLARPVRRSYSLYRTMRNGLVRNCGLRVVNVNTETRRYPTRPSKEVEAAPVYGSDPVSGRPTVVGNRTYSIEQGDEPVGGWGTVPGGNPRYSKPTTNAYVASPGPGYVFTGPGTDAQYDGAYWGAGGINTQPGNGYNPLDGRRARDQGKKGGKGGAEQHRGEGEQERQEEGQPGKEEKQPGRRLLFMRAFDESLVQIVQYESDVRNPRFGMPVMYRITLNDPRDMHGGIGLTAATVRVHWSRVIHLADNLGSSEIFGVPRMRPVLNRLLDLRKLYSGSAEMYWRGAFPGLALSTHPTLGGDVEVDRDKIRDTMENYFNGLQRYLMLMGMSAQTLSPQVVDPTSQISLQIEAICIQLGCPVRVFKGSERGELASSQDDSAWNDRLRERQNSYLTPRVIAPLVDRLIAAGVLPQPRGYSIEWPDLTSLSQTDKASLGSARAQALAAYTGVQPTGLIGKFDYLTRVIGMEDEEAAAVLQAAEAEAAQAAAAQAAVQAPVPIDPSLVQLADDGQGNQVPVIDDGQGGQVVVQDDGAGGYTLPAQQAVQLGLAPPEVLQGAGPVPPGTPPGTPPPGAPGAPPPTEPVPPGSPEKEALSDEEGDVPPPDEEDEGEDTDEGDDEGDDDDNPPGGGPRRTAPPGRKLPASGKPPLGNTAGPHDYASTQYNLPPRASRRVGKLAAMIEDEDLAGDGREDTPHVTVRYGLLSDEPAKALALATRLGPVHATLGEVKVFSAATNTVSDDSSAGLVTPTGQPDVVYIEVDAPLLHKLNRQLKQAYSHVEKYREYRPHVTLAYVKPGQGAKYAGPCTLTGLSFDLHDFVFSTREGKRSHLRDKVSNVFCATGEGGGIDPTCKRGDAVHTSRQRHHASSRAAGDRTAEAAATTMEAPRAREEAHGSFTPASYARTAEERAARAVQAAALGNEEEATQFHRLAAHSHDDAAVEHGWEAGRVTSSQDREGHLRAARAHRQASEAHGSAAREIYQGGRAVNSREVRREREQAAESTEEATRMLGGMKAYLRRPEASSQERELADVTEQAAVLKDEALDAIDPQEASRLHQEVAHLHERGSDLALEARNILRQSDVTLDNNRRIAELDHLGFRHREGQRDHDRAAYRLHRLSLLGHVTNVFCATGPGGGINPTCTKGESRQAPPEQHRASLERVHQHAEEAARLSRAAPVSEDYRPRLEADLAEATAAADRAQQALEQGDTDRAVRAHQTAANAHWDLLQSHDVLSSQNRRNQQAYEAHRQAYDAHWVAAQAHEAIIREVNQGGRGVMSRQLREVRADALARSSRLAHEAADEPDPTLREVAQEAGVLADRAEDTEEVNAAIQAHQEAEGAHRRAENLALQLMYDADAREDRTAARRYQRINGRHMDAALAHSHAQIALRELGYLGHVTNVFCATGQGGGVDPSCKRGESRQAPPEQHRTSLERIRQHAEEAARLSRAAPISDEYRPRVEADLAAAAAAADEARQALERGETGRAVRAHRRAAEEHWTLAQDHDVLSAQHRRNQQTYDAHRQAYDAHSVAAQSHEAMIREINEGGRAATARQLREARAEALAHSTRLAHRAADEPDPALREAAQEAGVLADRAEDEEEVGAALQAHQEATAAHRRAENLALHLMQDADQRGDRETARRYQRIMDDHMTAAWFHRRAQTALRELGYLGHVINVFCATGPGGGVDPSCTKGERRQIDPSGDTTASRQALDGSRRVSEETRNLVVQFGNVSYADDLREAARLTDRAEQYAREALDTADPQASAVRHRYAQSNHLEAAGLLHATAQRSPNRSRPALQQLYQAHREAADTHAAAAVETETGRSQLAARTQRFRQDAHERSQQALQASAARSEEARRVAEEAAVASDEAYDSRDPGEAAALHRRAMELHWRASNLHERSLEALRLDARGSRYGMTPEIQREVEAELKASHAHFLAAKNHEAASDHLNALRQLGHVANVFCATGPGGGVDPSCKRGEARQIDPSGDTRASYAAHKVSAAAAALIVPLVEHYGGEESWARRHANSARRLAERAERSAREAAQATSSYDSVHHHELAAESHRMAAQVLSTLVSDLEEANGAEMAEPARRAMEAHRDAVRTQYAAAAEARIGRDRRVRESQELRQAAHRVSQEALHASGRTPPGEARNLAAEASVKADEAQDAVAVEEAARLHQESADLHRRAQREHEREENLSRHRHHFGSHANPAEEETHRQAAEAHASAAYVHRSAASEQERAANHLESLRRTGHVANVFCATGEGGGVDPSCKRGEARQAPPENMPAAERADEATRRAHATHRPATLHPSDGHRLHSAGHAQEAVDASRRALEASSQEDTLEAHKEAALAHADAWYWAWTNPDRTAADQPILAAHDEAEKAHRDAIHELEVGRGTLARKVRDTRESASTLSGKALELTAPLGGQEAQKAQEAAVMKDEALDEVDPAAAAELHGQVSHKHMLVADSLYTRSRDRRLSPQEVQAVRAAYHAHRTAEQEHDSAAAGLHLLAQTRHVANSDNNFKPNV